MSDNPFYLNPREKAHSFVDSDTERLDFDSMLVKNSVVPGVVEHICNVSIP